MSEIPAWAVPGAKVVCVDDGPNSASEWGFGWFPTEAIFKGSIYTIKAVHFWRGIDVVVDLVEVARAAESISKWGPDAGYNIRRFRPLVARSLEQDVAEFRKLLDHIPEAVA